MNKEEQINKIIQNHVLYSMGLGIIPIPLVDIIAVTANQLDMISQLGTVYEKKFSEISGKSFIASVTGASLARVGASFIKAIPGIGSLIGGVSMSVMSGASTYAVGQVARRFFEDGIDLVDIDESRAKEIYEEELEKGKKVAADLKEKSKESKKEPANKTVKATQKTDSKIEKEPAKKETPKKDVSKKDTPKKEDDIYTKLQKLGDLKERGVISEEEFQEMKQSVLDKY